MTEKRYIRRKSRKNRHYISTGNGTGKEARRQAVKDIRKDYDREYVSFEQEVLELVSTIINQY